MLNRLADHVDSVLRLYFKMIYSLFQTYWFLCHTVLLSVFIYVCFYWLYLPSAQHVKPLYFQYDSTCNRKIDDGLCSFPKVSTLLHDGSDSAQDGNRVLSRGQAYDIQLEIEVPLTKNNKQLGMFMTSIDMVTKENVVVSSSSRSTMISSQNSVTGGILTVLKIVPLLLGIIDERELLVIPLLENYVDHSYQPAITANLTIQSKYLHFYNARLRITAIFTGLKYYMYNWPVIFSIFAFSIILFLVSSVSIIRAFQNSSSLSPSSADSNLEEQVENVNATSQVENANANEEEGHSSTEGSDSNNIHDVE